MDMIQMIKSFPNQILEQYENLKNEELDLNKFNNIDNIIIAGMGGSAISGDLVNALTKNEIRIPIHVVRDYNIPSWSGDRTLFIFSSYSGNTEETLSCFNSALSKSEMLISICTGGELQKISSQNHVKTILLPKGFQPRAALGFSLITLLIIFNSLGILKLNFIKTILDAASKLDEFYDTFCKEQGLAYNIASELKGSVIAIYGVQSSTEHIASRFRAQLAENSKVLATLNFLPEMNHNEIEGWNEKQFGKLKKCAIWISDKDDNPRILERIKITSDLLEPIGIKNIFLSIDGDNYSERCLKLLFLTDWISYYLAEINNIDPIPVNRIMDLKNKMS